MLTLGFLAPEFQFYKEHACLSSPPAPPLPRFDRNQFRAGRLTRLRYKSTHVQFNAPVRTRNYCWIKVADSQRWTHMKFPTRLSLIDPDWDYMIFLGNNSPGMWLKNVTRAPGLPIIRSVKSADWMAMCDHPVWRPCMMDDSLSILQTLYMPVFVFVLCQISLFV